MYRYEYVNHKLNMIFMRRNKWTWSKYMNMNMNTICTYIYKYLYVHKCKCVIMYINEYASILKIKYVMYIRMQIRMYVYVETCVFPFLRHHSSGELREGSLSTRTLCQDKWQSLWLANKLIPCWELTYPIQRQLGRWNSCSQLGYASFLEGNACKLSNVISDVLSKHKLPHCSAHNTGSHSQQSQKRFGEDRCYKVIQLMVV